MIVEFIEIEIGVENLISTWDIKDSLLTLPSHNDVVDLHSLPYIVTGRRWITSVYLKIYVDSLGNE